MTTPPAPLGPEQQQQLVNQIGLGLASMAAPGTWRQIRTEYRSAGRHVEADVIITAPDGSQHAVPAPRELFGLLGSLRAGMYQPALGTWLSGVVVVDPAQSVSADFSYDHEPRWRHVPPPIGFQDELRFYPRAEDRIPAWLRQRAGLPPLGPSTVDEIKSPRIYDGVDPSGRPLVNRPPLQPGERERILDYLGAAPVVLAARSYGADAFAPDRDDAVPMTFRTDGSWVWPGAVAYYLREHDVPPDPELVAHIRARQFVVPEVDEPARDLALAAVTGEPA